MYIVGKKLFSSTTVLVVILAVTAFSLINSAAADRVVSSNNSEIISNSIPLENAVGLKWKLLKTNAGWSLGSILLHNKEVEQAAKQGMLSVRNAKTGEIRWMTASQADKIDNHTARLSGQDNIDGANFVWTIEISLSKDSLEANFSSSWNVDRDLNNWEVCLSYHDGFSKDWRLQSYPWAGYSESVNISPMRYCGVPGVLVYRPDQSLVILFAIDSRTDYLNPMTWTGKTSFQFTNRVTAPQFRSGINNLKAGIKYELPLQLFLSDSRDFTGAITSIMQSWIKVNDYKVDTTLHVRTPQQAFDISVDGRRKMDSWKPGIGYEHHKGTPFIYVGNNPIIAYYEYRLYEMTGDKLWRERAFQQIDFAIKGQQSSGVFHTSYYFRKSGGATSPGYYSWDWGHNGYKVDINTWMVRYILQTWQRVKEKEGLDREDWHKAATASLSWILAQQNEDGGFPQVVDVQSGLKSKSVVCGRTLVGLPIIAAINGDKRCLVASAKQEVFLKEEVEGHFWYTGQHPDLPPEDFEQDSIYNVVEYWLDKYDRTNDQICLDHAVANAYYALLYWCPKQLSWVKNPTQGAHTEQLHFNQYSVYSYHNRKIQCLDRLFRKTGNPLFEQLRDRVIQLNFYTQVTEGPYRGSVSEAIADPWLERKSQYGFNMRGNPYTSELVSDLMLQLIDLGMVQKPY